MRQHLLLLAGVEVLLAVCGCAAEPANTDARPAAAMTPEQVLEFVRNAPVITADTEGLESVFVSLGWPEQEAVPFQQCVFLNKTGPSWGLWTVDSLPVFSLSNGQLTVFDYASAELRELNGSCCVNLQLARGPTNFSFLSGWGISDKTESVEIEIGLAGLIQSPALEWTAQYQSEGWIVRGKGEKDVTELLVCPDEPFPLRRLSSIGPKSTGVIQFRYNVESASPVPDTSLLDGKVAIKRLRSVSFDWWTREVQAIPRSLAVLSVLSGERDERELANEGVTMDRARTEEFARRAREWAAQAKIPDPDSLAKR